MDNAKSSENIMDDLEDELDWEDWDPSQSTFTDHLIAGSVAGWAEHIALYPVDTIKTHIQYGRGKWSPRQSMQSARDLFNAEGFMRLWRGVSTMFAGCVPAHAAYFSVYETSKKLLGADGSGHTPIRASLCGGMAAFSHDVFMTPFDLVKQRMQLGYYQNIQHCMKCIMRTEGIAGLYIALPATLMMNIPHGLVLVPVNESMRKMLNPSGKYDFRSSMLAGSVAGMVAAAVTNPLDVIRTRLQTQNLEASAGALVTPAARPSAVTGRPSLPGVFRTALAMKSILPNTAHQSASAHKTIQPAAGVHSFPSVATDAAKGAVCGDCGSRQLQAARANTAPPLLHGVVPTARQILAEGGARGFLRGIGARMLVHAPSAAISWTAYEATKSLLGEEPSRKTL